MKLKSIFLGVALAAAPVAASAATLSIFGGSEGTIPLNFNPRGIDSGVERGDTTTDFSAAAGEEIGGGLQLSDAAVVTFTFAGKEAGARNFFSVGDGQLSNQGPRGGSITTELAAGLIDFSFTTRVDGTLSSITNGGITDLAGLWLSFSEVSEDGQSIVALFGDGRGDTDKDDMIVLIEISDVVSTPLPAAGALLLTVLAGGLTLRRRRRT